MSAHKEVVRFTFDCPIELHTAAKMKAAVPRLSFSAERMARYCFMMPISSMRLVLAKTVVIGMLIFLPI